MESIPKFTDEELAAQDKELFQLIFEKQDGITHIGKSVPSDELIAQFYAELEELEHASAGNPKNDIIIGSV